MLALQILLGDHLHEHTIFLQTLVHARQKQQPYVLRARQSAARAGTMQCDGQARGSLRRMVRIEDGYALRFSVTLCT